MESPGQLLTETISKVASEAIRQKRVGCEDRTALILYDLDLIESRIGEIQSAFPENSLHTVAVKANPLIKILNKMASMEVGAEAATLPELEIALSAGFDPSVIVFDSPTKTCSEIRRALDLGCYINADSILELDRIDDIFRSLRYTSRSKIGVRINPQVGTGKIESTSVAGLYSKFGVPLREQKEQLLKRFLEYRWLKGIHMHIGSQGVDMDMLLRGAATLESFLTELNQLLEKQAGNQRLEFIDIGGGLPVTYGQRIIGLNVGTYAKELETVAPNISSDKTKLITEFGRFIHANAGWTISSVEYVKEVPSSKTAMIHVGADLLLRKCYRPDDWHHDLIVLDKKGNIKPGLDQKKYIVAGPLCFAGDIIAQDVELPCVQPGDYIVIKDTGAYTASMWSRYNSRQMPEIVGYRAENPNFETIRKRETPQDLIQFWQ